MALFLEESIYVILLSKKPILWTQEKLEGVKVLVTMPGPIIAATVHIVPSLTATWKNPLNTAYSFHLEELS